MATDFHSHYAVSIICSLDSVFRIEGSDGEELVSHFVALGANYKHRLIAMESRLIVIQIDPHSSVASGVSHWLRKARAHSLSIDRIEGIRDKLILLFEDIESPDHPGSSGQGLDPIDLGFQAFLGILGSLELDQRRARIPDERILKVQRWIQSGLEKPIRINDFASRLGLSETRLMHLFKQETGIPMRRYVLWCRLSRSAYSLKGGKTLTDAAYEGGFSDQAHMSRTFKEMLGVSPSHFIGPNTGYTTFFMDSEILNEM